MSLRLSCTTWAGPERFLNMLRVAKPTSPMSVGTWILSAVRAVRRRGAGAELAALLPAGSGSPVGGCLPLVGPAGSRGGVDRSPASRAYTAVLLTDTATPSWHEAYRELPFVFVASAAAASGGLGMIGAPPSRAGPARRLAPCGPIVELRPSGGWSARWGSPPSRCTTDAPVAR